MYRMQKYVPLVNRKIEVFILGGQIIDKKRKKGWRRGRRVRIEKGGEREDRDREKRDKRELS